MLGVKTWIRQNFLQSKGEAGKRRHGDITLHLKHWPHTQRKVLGHKAPRLPSLPALLSLFSSSSSGGTCVTCMVCCLATSNFHHLISWPHVLLVLWEIAISIEHTMLILHFPLSGGRGTHCAIRLGGNGLLTGMNPAEAKIRHLHIYMDGTLHVSPE